MKFRSLVALLLITLSATAQKGSFTLKNSLNINREQELITISRTEIEKRCGKEPLNKFLHGSINKKEIIFQFDDLNNDGKWDEIAFLKEFKPLETTNLELSYDVNYNKPESRAHVRQRRKISDVAFGPQLTTDSVPAGQPNTDFSKVKLPPFLTEGPAWENDKVGFRIYMDIRNTKDIWGKTTAKMMMDTVGANPKAVYHNLASWGMDILAVGKSLGAGSLALNVPRPEKQDTLVRLGGINMGKIIYEKVSDGPYRAIFRMHYPQWNVLGDGKMADVTEEISIWGGQYFYQSKVTITHAPAGAALVTGIVNLKSKKADLSTIADVKTLYTHDLQSENKDALGMAVMVKANDLLNTGQTSNTAGDVRNTYTVTLKTPAKGAVAFRYYAAWERSDPKFATAAGFKDYLDKEAVQLASPINVK